MVGPNQLARLTPPQVKVGDSIPDAAVVSAFMQIAYPGREGAHRQGQRLRIGRGAGR